MQPNSNQHPYTSIESEKVYNHPFSKYKKTYAKRLLPLRAQGVEAYLTRSVQGMSSKLLVADSSGLKFYKLDHKLASGNDMPSPSNDFPWSNINLSIGTIPIKGGTTYVISIHEASSQKPSVFRLHKTSIQDYYVNDLIQVLNYWHSNFGAQVNVDQAESLGGFAHSV